MLLTPTPPAKEFTIPSGLLQTAVNAQNFESPDRQRQETHLDSLPRSVVAQPTTTGGLGRSLSVVRTANVKWTSGPGRRARSSSLPSTIGEGVDDDSSRLQSPFQPPMFGFSGPPAHLDPLGLDVEAKLPNVGLSHKLSTNKPSERSNGGLVRSISRALSRRNKRSSIIDVYEKAKLRGAEIQRQRWSQLMFEYTIYIVLLCFVYFVLIGVPLWNGAVWWLFFAVQYKMVMAGGFAITIGIAAV